MPSETNSDKIAKLERLTAVLEERIDQQKEVMGRLEKDYLNEINCVDLRMDELLNRVHTVESKIFLISRDAEKLEKRVDEVITHRWELWKLFLAAFLGSLLSIAMGWANQSIVKLLGPAQTQQIQPRLVPPGRE